MGRAAAGHGAAPTAAGEDKTTKGGATLCGLGFSDFFSLLKMKKKKQFKGEMGDGLSPRIVGGPWSGMDQSQRSFGPNRTHEH